MDLMETITTRRSVRRYLERRIDKATVKLLLDAAAEAPSASNAQPWAFAVIQDRQLLTHYSAQAKNYLLSLAAHRPRLEKYRDFLTDKDFDIFYGTSTLIIIYAKPEEATAQGDCCLAAQNLMLRAHDLGLGSCWIGMATPLLDLEYIKASLGIPLNHTAAASIVIGYPAAAPPHPPRREPEVICWRE